MKRSLLLLALLGAAAVAAAGQDTAQSGAQDAAPPREQVSDESDARILGSSMTGAKVVSRSRMEQTATLVRAEAKLSGYARIFKKTREVARLEGLSQVKGGASTNAIRMKIGGRTVLNASKPVGWRKSWKYSRTFFKRSRTIVVGGIPISCTAKIGGTVYVNLEMGLALVGAGLEGRAGANAWGKAIAGLDLVFLRPGVRAKLTLLDNWLQLNVTAGIEGFKGSVAYKARAVRVTFSLILQKAVYKWRKWKLRRYWRNWKSKRIASWSAGNVTVPLFSF